MADYFEALNNRLCRLINVTDCDYSLINHTIFFPGDQTAENHRLDFLVCPVLCVVLLVWQVGPSYETPEGAQI